MKVIHLDDLHTARWSGGTTTQLAIDPAGSLYADRGFRWRLSTAVVEEEESVFTPLPDYNRLLTTRRGNLLLKHGAGEWYELTPGQIASFDGAVPTVSRGQVTDFNLMLRKGVVTGEMIVKQIPSCTSENRAVALTELFPSWNEAPSESVLGVFLSDGNSVTLRGADMALLHMGEISLFDGGREFAGYWALPSAACHIIGVRIDNI